MNKLYVVAVHDARHLPASLRIAAEVRFATELERVLGDEAAVARVLHAWSDASERDPSELDAQTTTLAARWPGAVDAATRAGLRDLGDPGEARFEVRLDLSTH